MYMYIYISITFRNKRDNILSYISQFSITGIGLFRDVLYNLNDKNSSVNLFLRSVLQAI